MSGLYPNSYLKEAMAGERSRSSWNDRLVNWERPASDHEEDKIQRAAGMVRKVVAGNAWLTSEAVAVEPQGSYFNNTNVRTEADMDLQVVHPSVLIQYAPGVIVESAYRELGYYSHRLSYGDIATLSYTELLHDLRTQFGHGSVKPGNKAIRVAGLSGSRAEVDVVPAMRLHYVRESGLYGGHTTVEGVAILARDETWTYNYPQQHHDNGKAKRAATQHRFKKVVRQLKKMNYELAALNLIPEKLPSFLIECLVYNVEDVYFLIGDDRYIRLIGILNRIGQLVSNPFWAANATEINGIKPMFTGQPWTVLQVQSFVLAALTRMGA